MHANGNFSFLLMISLLQHRTYMLCYTNALLNGSGDDVIYRFWLIQRTAARNLTKGEYPCHLLMTLHGLPGTCGISDLGE